MTDHLLFIGTVTQAQVDPHQPINGKTQAQSPTIWVSRGIVDGITYPINAAAGVFWENGGNALSAPGPVLFFYNGKIYGQSLIGPELLVWDTHGAPGDPAHLYDWTLGVYEYTENGNAAGTPLNPQGFTVYNGRTYFNGSFGGTASGGGTLLNAVGELFTTDHLQMIPGPNGVGGGLNPSSLAVATFGSGEKLYFSGWNNGIDSYDTQYNVLFSWDGTNFNQIGGVLNPAYLTVVDGSLYFAAQNPSAATGETATAPYWLYTYNGANNPASIDPTSWGLAPYNLVSLTATAGFTFHGSQVAKNQQVLLFSGIYDNSGDRGLWMSLGANGPTKQISPSSGNPGYPYNLTQLNGKLYFTAAANGSRTLFVYDPATNTNQFSPVSGHQLEPDNDSLISGNTVPGVAPITMTALNGDLYFNAVSTQPNSNPQLYKANLNAQGTGASPALVASLPNGLDPVWLSAIDL
jgi:hypothetical protein